jgi:rare lipoprotein A
MPLRLCTAVFAALLLAACNGGNLRGDGPPPSGRVRIPDLPADPVPRPEPKSRYGNGPVYEVFGKRYTVMPSSAGYSERGVASWYGRKFHGNLTSSREPYDMYEMTAAHKSLPLPTYVRVRNLQNNKSVVVRVNDRGPFVHNRIIDLSYAAAMKLDMIRDGTGLVEVTAISFDPPSGDRPTRQVVPAAAPSAPGRPAAVDASGRSDEATAVVVTETNPATPPPGNDIYVQVGAFGDRANAERRLSLLASAGIVSAFVHEDTSTDPALLRVRIGPVADVIQYDILVEELEGIGIMDPYLVVD